MEREEFEATIGRFVQSLAENLPGAHFVLIAVNEEGLATMATTLGVAEAQDLLVSAVAKSEEEIRRIMESN